MAVGAVLSVTKLNEYVSGILSNEPHLRSVRVSGEISGFKRHSSGHLYFNLKDAGAVVACVMFRSDAAKLKIDPRDGMQVVVRGSVSVYVKDGRYQLYAAGMTAAGEGELYAAFLQLKDRLQAEGVFENARDLPLMPRCIGVATSPVGAALRDIVNIIRRRFPRMNILFAPCSVQGESAPAEIAAAINSLQKFDYCDVIIVGRGGGSYEDLFCFNSELVARAIASSRVPVVSAVGHETDYTIADFAADLRAPTPSAAAELCCPLYADALYSVRADMAALRDNAKNAISAGKRDLLGIMGSAALAAPAHSIDLFRQKLHGRLADAEHRCKTALSSRRAELTAAVQRLSDASPRAVMRRGYVLLTDRKGDVISSASQLTAGEAVRIEMTDGAADAVIGNIELCE